jgi:threonine synthase
MQHLCLNCQTEYPTGFHPFCDSCGCMVDVTYPLDQVQLVDSSDPYIRFAGLLPLEAPANLPPATYSPLLHARRLGQKLGLNAVYLTDETALPTGTTKDRMAAVALAYLHQHGVRAFTCSSTGNSSTAFAYRVPAYPDMHVYIFTAEKFVSRVQYSDHAQVTHFGMKKASFVQAAEYAAQYAREHQLISEAGFFNPGRREGLKLAFLEACDQVPAPIDWYVQAVSSAMGVYGAYKGAQELYQLNHIKQLPRLLCVQQASCAPMVRAFAENSDIIRPEHRIAQPSGIAEAILRGDPSRAYPHIRRIVMQSGGTFVAVGEAEIRAAREDCMTLEGVSICFSAAASVAGLAALANAGAIAPDAVIVVNLTGSDRPSTGETANIQWLEPRHGGWAPSS